MVEFDLVIRGATPATAGDVFRTDIGVRAGPIAALAIALSTGRREIDANGLLVLPGGIDATAISTSRPGTNWSWPTTSPAERGRQHAAGRRR
jgi:dihydropyrimidinase